MDDVKSAESPLEAAAQTVSADTAEAFKLLADETRLAILLALWEEHEPLPEHNVSFSELLERVDYDNRGNFSYHLEKLEGRFVTQHTERGGYELRTAGLKLVRSIIAGTGIDEVSVDGVEIDDPCPVCDAPATTINYQDGVVLWNCTQCDGVAPGVSEWGTVKEHMDGILALRQFEPAGVAARDPMELRTASKVAKHQEAQSMFNGVCPTCSGQVDGRVAYCEDHDPQGGCDNCGWLLELLVRFQCRTCEEYLFVDPGHLALFHPAVVALYEEHGISTRIHTGDLGSASRLFEIMTDHEREIISENPLRMAVTAEVADGDVRVTFDETASIVDVRR